MVPFLNEDPVVQLRRASAERIGEITVPTLLVVGDSTTEYQKIEVDRLVEGLPMQKSGLREQRPLPARALSGQVQYPGADFMAAVGADLESQSTRLDTSILSPKSTP